MQTLAWGKKPLVRLGAKRVICGVRSINKGEAAKAEIEAETKTTDIIDIYELNLSNYVSVKNFAANVAKLSRVDIAILNAGVAPENYEVTEDNENTITVNVVRTTLLILLLLPILRSSATNWGIQPVMTIVGSGVHAFTRFPERKTANSLETLNNKATAVISDR